MRMPKHVSSSSSTSTSHTFNLVKLLRNSVMTGLRTHGSGNENNNDGSKSNAEKTKRNQFLLDDFFISFMHHACWARAVAGSPSRRMQQLTGRHGNGEWSVRVRLCVCAKKNKPYRPAAIGVGNGARHVWRRVRNIPMDHLISNIYLLLCSHAPSTPAHCHDKGVYFIFVLSHIVVWMRTVCNWRIAMRIVCMWLDDLSRRFTAKTENENNGNEVSHAYLISAYLSSFPLSRFQCFNYLYTCRERIPWNKLPLAFIFLFFFINLISLFACASSYQRYFRSHRIRIRISLCWIVTRCLSRSRGSRGNGIVFTSLSHLNGIRLSLFRILAVNWRVSGKKVN